MRLFAIEDALDSDAWYTPAWVFDGLGLTFDLDVAGPSEPLPWIPAAKTYTVADDGLLQPWYGTVWCNPPYSNLAPWCKRWAAHGDGCLLIPPDLSATGPIAALAAATSVWVARGRLRFVNGHGTAASSPNFSAVLFGCGAHVDAALHRLSAHFGGSARTLERAA